MTYGEFLTLIDERSAALRDAVAAAAVSDARVPGCPDWDLGDLVAHVGAVQRFWAVVVTAGDPSGPPPPEALGDREPHGDLLTWSAESTDLLLAALRSSSADAPAWAWWGSSDAPLTARAIARHQVQEAAVHAFDAQQTAALRPAAGQPATEKLPRLPAAIAVDGVAEFLEVGVGSLGAWPHRPARLAFDAVDGPTSFLDLTPAGGRVSPAGGGEPVAVVRAPASDLVLALYGRVSFDELPVEGDREVLALLRAWSNPD